MSKHPYLKKAEKYLNDAYYYLCDYEDDLDVELTEAQYNFLEKMRLELVFYMNRIHARLPEFKPTDKE